MEEDKRYFLGSDNSGHNYLVLVEKRKEWFEWLDIPEDDERSWKVPEYAKILGISLAYVTFTNPIVEK